MVCLARRAQSLDYKLASDDETVTRTVPHLLALERDIILDIVPSNCSGKVALSTPDFTPLVTKRNHITLKLT